MAKGNLSVWGYKFFYTVLPESFRGLVPAVGFIASVIALSLFAFSFFTSENSSDQSILILSSLLAIFVFLTGILFSLVLQRGTERRLLKDPNVFEQMGARAANSYIQLLEAPEGREEKELQNVLRQMLDNFRDVIWLIVQDEVVVSIKVRVEESFYTMCRNSDARQGRPEGVEFSSGSISENTEFTYIASKEVSIRPHYVNHNLYYSADSKEYRNSDPQWRDKYGTIITVPIYCQDYGGGYIVGCLCLDAQKPGLFLKGEELIINLLKEQAGLIFIILHTFIYLFTDNDDK